ncbi:MAG TPA: Mur ligase domain-containing protein, partial [Phycisphaerales bacterium]|nr:Mur ligase domain-containing protein [Phycisphaerales bacterium]
MTREQTVVPAAAKAAMPGGSVRVEVPSMATTRSTTRGPSTGLHIAGKSVYMIGIGGCGMCGLARLFRSAGAKVSGSDLSRSNFTSALERDGFKVAFDQSGQGAGAIPEACDLIVASAAIKPDHPQVLAAERRGIPVLSYAEALGKCMLDHTGACVAGTHGKSTTTAMLGTSLSAAGLDPSVIVGATCPQLGDVSTGGGGFRLGAQKIPQGSLAGEPGLLVVEACEFNRSFHNYHPRVAAITSVEADHLDVYGSLEEVVASFHEFARLIPSKDEGGVLLIAQEGAHRREVTAGLKCDVQTIGWSPSCDWSVQYEPGTRKTGLVRKGEGLVCAWVTSMPGEHNAMNGATACALATILGADPDKVAQSLSEFKGLERKGEGLVCAWVTSMPGEHNAMNGATACALATILGADPDKVAQSLSEFKGLERRMQLLGQTRAGVRVYDDYGHHPTEVETTLKALRDFEKPQERGGRLICVFQPHQHSRTRFLLDEFAAAFSGADIVIVPHIYFVRDSQAEKQKVCGIYAARETAD